MSDETMAYRDFTAKCFDCGGLSTYRNGRQRFHACRLRLIRRLRWAAYLEGWHAAHRFAVENLDDPMVLADAEDYGSGWASFMRPGGGSIEVPA